jgi:transcriptional regulator with XRE-family HTH domain
MNRLKGRRTELGYTQEQVAEQIGVHPNTYRKYESGTKAPTLDVIKRLAQVLHIKTIKLVEWLLENK